MRSCIECEPPCTPVPITHHSASDAKSLRHSMYWPLPTKSKCSRTICLCRSISVMPLSPSQLLTPTIGLYQQQAAHRRIGVYPVRPESSASIEEAAERPVHRFKAERDQPNGAP